MKTTLPFAIATLALLVSSGSAQNPAAQSEQRLLALVQEVQAQQSQIASNQDKIDSKVAEVAEAIRLARIFAGRGGK
jgi:outer membrane lipoprotein-sorting protein